MELTPALEIGWLNGWILLCVLYLFLGVLVLSFPKDARVRLFKYDRSRWSIPHRIIFVMGKSLAFVYIIMIVFTPLKIGSVAFIPGIIIFTIGLALFTIALLNFKNTPLDQPVTRGIYGISRHPQILSLFILAFGICMAIGSWLALFLLIISPLFGRCRILEEEKACREQYGDLYRAYMKRVPRYFLIRTHMRREG